VEILAVVAVIESVKETFLLNEADKILTDPPSTRREKAFAGIVYQLVSEWLIDELEEDE
jgi:hypothetical protein